MWNEYHNVTSVEDALEVLAKWGRRARIVAGGTDLILDLERGVRKGVDVLVDISRIPGLDQIMLDEDGIIHLGALVTHSHCVSSKLIVEQAFPLARACVEVGAPQIRNRGTVAGNLITASPANDTISPLMALDARVVLRSVKGERTVPLHAFYTGVRRTIMRSEEMLVEIQFPAMQPNQCGTFYKLGLRRAQAISVVNAAVLLTLEDQRIQKAVITLGSVTPTIVHATEAENFLVGRRLDEKTMLDAAALAKLAANPIADVRSGRDYRLEMVRACVLRSLRALSSEKTRRSGFPERPVLLHAASGRWANADAEAALQENTLHLCSPETPIITHINGREYTFTGGQHKTLLRLLREDAGLIGSKEGCAEGECGACTVYLDGKAVMACLVPAPRAHGAQIWTIEGIAPIDALHPVQQAFIDQGAVQCGYCTPGFVMSAVMLLDELAHPTREEIQQAISGNLCRCTGYYSILSAIEQAAETLDPPGGV